MSRTARLQLSWWRLPRSARQPCNKEVQFSVEENVREYLPHQAQTQTIEQQLHLLREYSQKQGWEWNEEHMFRDDGCSGASLRRPGLDHLRDQVRNAAFDRVLITEPSRLARKYVHQMLLMEEFERGGCQIEFVDQPMSGNPHDQWLIPHPWSGGRV